MKNLCVFCGSREGTKPAFKESAVELGRKMVQEKINLVYGGSKAGLMGAISKVVLEGGGRVYGVSTNYLGATFEQHHKELEDLEVVDSMHDRKRLLIEKSDAFLAIPGGIGTLDEIAEVLTLSSIGQHRRPIGLLNVEGYYDNLLAFFKTMSENKFHGSFDDLIWVGEDIEAFFQYARLPFIET